MNIEETIGEDESVLANVGGTINPNIVMMVLCILFALVFSIAAETWGEFTSNSHFTLMAIGAAASFWIRTNPK